MDLYRNTNLHLLFILEAFMILILFQYFSYVAVFKDLVKIHRSLMLDICDSIVNKNDQNLYQVFIKYKER